MFIAILGDRRGRLPNDQTKETAVAVAAEPASMRPLAPAAMHRSPSSLLGDLEIRLPAGTRITEGGHSLVGDTEIDLSPAMCSFYGATRHGWSCDVRQHYLGLPEL